MKDIVTYINEVSKKLVKRAYDKAEGAQKNRIKRLYKAVYDDEIDKDISYKFSIEQFEKLAKENGNGIYVIYKDHLSCDAWVMFAVKNNNIEDKKSPCCWATRNYYGDGKPCGASVDLKNLIEKYSDLTLYISNLSYQTFRGKWFYEDVANNKIYKDFKFKVFDVKSKAEKENE